MKRVVYECDACGRADLKPIPQNHFREGDPTTVCGAPTVAREYQRVKTVESLGQELKEKMEAA